MILSRVCAWAWRQSWLPHRRARKIYKHLCPANPSHPFRVDFYGDTYEGDCRNRIDREVFFHGAFEKPVIHLLRDELRASKHGTFIDIGANVGHHSLYLAKYAKRIHAFEPYAKVRDQAERLFKLNHCDQIVLHPIGLSDDRAELTFYEPPENNLGKGTFDSKLHPNQGQQQVLSVEVGDTYFRDNDIQDIDVIKIDVEGFEQQVLKGLRDTLTRERPVVLFECSKSVSCPINSEAELVALFPDNYQFYTFKRGNRWQHARNKRRGDYELVPFSMDAFMSNNKLAQCNIIAKPATT